MENQSTDYDIWNKQKKRIQASPSANIFPKEGEIWISIFGKNIGYEQNGIGDNFSRPVLIIKKFNNQMFWCVPLSTKQKKFDFYFNFLDPNNKKVSLILAQLKLMSIKRFNRKIYTISDNHIFIVKERLKKFLS